MALYFKRFENIPRPGYLGGGTWTLENLNEITVIFGKNGTGKSMLLRKLRDTNNASFHYASPERAGEISYNAGFVQEEQSGDSRANKRNRNLAPTYREEVIARIQAYLSKRGNQRTRKIRVEPSLIEDELQILMPDFKFKIKDGNPPYSLTRILTDQPVSSVNDLSSGESEVLTLALDLLLICALWKLDRQKKTVLLVDEPDTHLHPDLQQHLAKFLVKVAADYKVQILVSTHSTTLLSALGYHGKDKTSVIYLNNVQEAQKATKFNGVLQQLATCLGGHALMGPLFNAPLVLVEGDDDYRVWSQVPRHGKINLSVIPCNGDEINNYQKTLETIFASLLGATSSPSGYLIKDSDKSCSDVGQHIKCLLLACHEVENLYLTDEVLQSMGTTWEQARTEIKNQSNNFGNKAEHLQQVDSWDRKTIDLKSVINEISVILDAKKVPWTMRIGKCIGAGKPQGQLAEFLGDGIVGALWE